MTPAAYSYRDDPAVPQFADDKPVIVFDGYCAFCSAWARFVLRFDRDQIFRLLPAQSPLGRALYVHYGLDPENYETNIVLMDGVPWFKSEAAIRAMAALGFPWSLARGARVLPLSWRDALYGVVARNRFRSWGGVTCALRRIRKTGRGFWHEGSDRRRVWDVRRAAGAAGRR